MSITILTPSEGVTFLLDLDRQIKSLEEQLSVTKKQRHELETDTLPRLFADADVVELQLPSGAKAKLGMMVTGSLPKVSDDLMPAEKAKAALQRATAIEWLHVHGYDPVIKSSVVAQWDKGESEKARKFYDSLRGDNSVNVTLKEDVHAQTLCAAVRDRLRRGLETPLEMLGVTALTAVRLTKKPTENP